MRIGELNTAVADKSGDILVESLRPLGELGRSDLALLRALPLRVVPFARGQEVVRQGAKPSDCCMVIGGLVFRAKILAEGQRQILSLHFRGEFPDLARLHLTRPDHGLYALSPSLLGFIPQQALHEAVAQSPAIAAALWKLTLIDAAITHEWLVGAGRRSAAERMAHLFCELYCRAAEAGVAGGPSFHLPLTQTELADALGLSVVHVNRVLQDLRRSGLIVFKAGRFEVQDWNGLKALAGFDPDYLHLLDKAPEDLR